MKLQLDRAFSLLEYMETNVLEETPKVDETVNATDRIQQEHEETVRILESIRTLTTQSYLSLNNTIDSLLKEIQTSFALLDDWMRELEQIKTQSLGRVNEIGFVNKTINRHLRTAQSLVTKAMADANNAVNLLRSLALRIPLLQANTSDVKEIGKSAYEAARQRYNNASIVFNVTSHLDVGMSNHTPSIAKVVIIFYFQDDRESKTWIPVEKLKLRM